MKLDCDATFCNAFDGSIAAVVSLRDGVALLRHQIIARAVEGEWSTDEDRFGVVLLDAGLRSRVIDIPGAFGMQRTGAGDAKRSFELERVEAEGIVCALVSPFSDARGWGAETLRFRFDLRTEVWEPVDAARRRRTTAVEPRGRSYASGSRLDWRLSTAGMPSLELDGCDAYLRARPELASVLVTKTFALGGASLEMDGEMHIVVGARAFIEDAPYRDFVLVLRPR